MGALVAIKSANSGFPLGPLENYKNAILANPLMQRVTSNWKVILMDSNTILAATCCVATLLSAQLHWSVAFGLIAISSGVATFYLRQFSKLNDLEVTARDLKASKERFESIATNLEKENQILQETNRELQRTNEAFRATNEELQRTNAAFQATNRDLQSTNDALRQTNSQLTTQVTQLTLQVTQLRESAERIKTEMVRFQQENTHLHHNVRGFDQSLHTLDQQILASRSLCDQIANHLTSQQRGLGEQLGQLRQYLADLRADNRVHQRIQELGTLQQQVQEATTQLHQLQVQYATERANFQSVHQSLVQLKNQFDAAIRDAVASMQSNNQQLSTNIAANQQQFQNNVNALSSERQRIQQILNRYVSIP